MFVFADGTVEKYGFKYSYELVGYHKGNNETSESAHLCIEGFCYSSSDDKWW